jgi:hypothetical protein
MAQSLAVFTGKIPAGLSQPIDFSATRDGTRAAFPKAIAKVFDWSDAFRNYQYVVVVCFSGRGYSRNSGGCNTRPGAHLVYGMPVRFFIWEINS